MAGILSPLPGFPKANHDIVFRSTEKIFFNFKIHFICVSDTEYLHILHSKILAPNNLINIAIF